MSLYDELLWKRRNISRFQLSHTENFFTQVYLPVASGAILKIPRILRRRSHATSVGGTPFISLFLFLTAKQTKRQPSVACAANLFGFHSEAPCPSCENKRTGKAVKLTLKNYLASSHEANAAKEIPVPSYPDRTHSCKHKGQSKKPQIFCILYDELSQRQRPLERASVTCHQYSTASYKNIMSL